MSAYTSTLSVLKFLPCESFCHVVVTWYKYDVITVFTCWKI
jgi:hypothetical protein